MKIGLARPNYRSHLITPPLGLGYISSFLKARGMETKIIDGLNLNLSNPALAARFDDCDIVGITCLTDYSAQAIQLSGMLKANGKVVVIGGPHASSLPELTLKESGADYVFIGEGEAGFYELARELSSGKGKLNSGADGFKPQVIKGEEVRDINSLPFPDWRQIHPKDYKHAPHGGIVKRFPVAPVVSTRGCPFSCKFCASPFLWGRRIRLRSPGNIADEIEYLIKYFGVREVHFEDDNFTFNPAHASGVCEEILKRRLKLSWALPNGVRVNSLSCGLMRLMKQSGCYSLAFGIESGNQGILDGVNKGIDLAEVEKAVRMASKLGLITQGFFIFGLPGETEASIEQTLKFALKLPLDRAQFLFFDPLPGSKLWEELGMSSLPLRAGRSFQEVKWVPPTVDLKTLQRALPCSFRRFFFRRRQISLIIKYTRVNQLPYIYRRLRDFKVFG